MSTRFNDLDTREYERQQEAEERRRHLKIVRGVLTGEDENDALDREAAILTQDFADTTDAASLLLAHLKFAPHLRAFVDAVIGAAGGADDFVEMTDKTLAERMGRSTKTVQNDRNEFRAWPDHGAVIEIKDNWRDPDTHESHAHAYRCHIDKLAVEATQNARISPEWSRNRHKALEEAARTVGDSAPCFPPRKKKRQKKPSDAEVLRRNLQQAAKLIDQAASLRAMVRNPDFEEVWLLSQELAERLKAFNEAFGFESPTSTQKKEVRRVEIDAPAAPSEPSAESTRMEAENGVERQVETQVERQVERQVETQVEAGQVEKTSTCNESTESTTYENQDFSPPEFPPRSADPETAREYQKLSEEYARDVKKAITDKVASGKTPESAYAETEREIGEFEQWMDRRPTQYFDSICHRLKGSAPNAAAAT
jgi:hypothetical protein